VAYFLSLKKTVSQHHVYHAIHHNHTIKTPRYAPRISRKPLEKQPFTSAEKISTHKLIFHAQNSKEPGSLPALWVTKSVELRVD